MLTKLRRFQLFSTSQNISQNSISSFYEKNISFGFPCCSTREDLSIDLSITNVGLILTKLRWFQFFVISQNSNFEFFLVKIQIFGFPGCSTRDELSIDVSITNVGLILTKLWWFLYSGYGQTDTVCTQNILTQSSKLVFSCRSLYASPEDRGCIITEHFNMAQGLSAGPVIHERWML